MKRQILVSICLLLCAAVTWAAVEPVSSQKMELRSGWNLVTLTRPLDAKGAETFLALNPMTLKNNGYVLCNTSSMLIAGCGYWVFSREAVTVEQPHWLR